MKTILALLATGAILILLWGTTTCFDRCDYTLEDGRLCHKDIAVECNQGGMLYGMFHIVPPLSTK